MSRLQSSGSDLNWQAMSGTDRQRQVLERLILYVKGCHE